MFTANKDAPEATSTVPHINLTGLPKSKAQVSAAMMSAASCTGFFHVAGKRIVSHGQAGLMLICHKANSACRAGHGLAQADIDAAFAVSVR